MSTAVTNSDVKIFRVRVGWQLDPNIQPVFLLSVLERDHEIGKLHLKLVLVFSPPMVRDGVFELSLEVRYYIPYWVYKILLLNR